MTLAVHLQPLRDEATMRPVHECVLCLTGVEASTKQTRIEFKSDPSTRKRDVKKHDLKILPHRETWLTKRRKCIAAILPKKGSVSRNYVKVSHFSEGSQQRNCTGPSFYAPPPKLACVPSSSCCFAIVQTAVFPTVEISKSFPKYAKKC